MAKSLDFQGEFEKLLAILPEAATKDEDKAAVDAYSLAYAKTIPEKHQKYFKAIYDKDGYKIVTETTVGDWLGSSEHRIVFGKSKVAALPLSAIYRQAVARAAGGVAADSGLVPLYPKIILLHVYRIFNLIEPIEALAARITVLEHELRDDPQSNSDWGDMLKQYAAPMLDVFSKNFAGVEGDNKKLFDTLTKSPELGNAVNNAKNSFGDLASIGPALIPALMEQFAQVQSGKTDVMTGLTNVLNSKALEQHVGKLDGLKPLMSQATKMLKEQGIDMPEAVSGDLSNVTLTEMVKQIMATPDAQKEISSFNEKATKVVRDPAQIASLMSASQNPRQDNLIPFASAGGPAAAGPNMAQLQQMLAAMPPDQLAQMMKEMGINK
jgi:hypothetical protein